MHDATLIFHDLVLVVDVFLVELFRREQVGHHPAKLVIHGPDAQEGIYHRRGRRQDADYRLRKNRLNQSADRTKNIKKIVERNGRRLLPSIGTGGGSRTIFSMSAPCRRRIVFRLFRLKSERTGGSANHRRIGMSGSSSCSFSIVLTLSRQNKRAPS
ncbi:hypothetical protein [Cohnella sp. JJ-181]|uniref:hypothetical protein n=1 Tax=Cohnella rhizoplanae TaxID=2974897 RepID=UPI00232D896A|nr:hypothetical protein [Cohnella sp. JJ-181]